MAVYELVTGSLDGRSRERPRAAPRSRWSRSGCGPSYELARPLDRVRAALIVGWSSLAVGAFTIPFVADFFLLDIPPGDDALWVAAIVAPAAALIHAALHLVGDPDRRP